MSNVVDAILDTAAEEQRQRQTTALAVYRAFVREAANGSTPPKGKPLTELLSASDALSLTRADWSADCKVIAQVEALDAALVGREKIDAQAAEFLAGKGAKMTALAKRASDLFKQPCRTRGR